MLFGARLSEFVEGWKHKTNDPYMLSIVAKGYRLRFTSPPLLRKTPWEIRSPQGPDEVQGMSEQISLMLQKNAIMEVPPNSPGFYLDVFLVCTSMQSVRRVASSDRLKKTEHSHFHTTLSYVHY